MAENRTYNDSPTFIPSRLESSVHSSILGNGNKGPVADAKDIYDINHGKWQKDINDEIETVPVEIERIDGELGNRYTKEETYNKTEIDTKESGLQGQINTIKGGSTKSIATIDNEINGSNGINERLQTVEALGEISVGGGDIQIATGGDFDDPDASQKAKAVTVGAVLGGIINTPVFDLTVYTGDTYADLEAALAVMGDVSFPAQLKKGGMSIKFVQSSDNKYVQFRLMSDSFNTTVANWQGVDDEATAGSDNLVKSGGCTFLGYKQNGYIASGKWTDVNSDSRQHYIVKIPSSLRGFSGSMKGSVNGQSILAFLSSYNVIEGSDANVVGPLITVNDGGDVTFTVHSSAEYLYVFCKSGIQDRTPRSIILKDIDIINSPAEGVLAAQVDTKVANDINTLFSKVKYSQPAIRLWSTGAKPNVDSNQNILTFSADTTILVGNTQFTIAAGTVINLALQTSVYSTILLHLADGSFNTVARAVDYDIAEDVVFGFAVTSDSNNTKKRYYFPFSYTIDGNDVEDIGVLKKSSIVYNLQRETSLEGLDSYVSTNYKPGQTGTRVEYKFPVLPYKSKFSISATSEYQFIIRFYDDNGTIIYNSSSYIRNFSMTDALYQSYDEVSFIAIYWKKNDDAATSIEDIVENGVSSMTIDVYGTSWSEDKDPGIFKDIYKDINTLSGKATGILDFNPEKEVLPIIQNLIRRYITYGNNAMEWPPVCCFIHCSDVHADNTNILRIKEFYDKYSSYISDVIDTGDFIGGSWSDGLPSSTSEVSDFIRVIGNHDTYNLVGTPPNHSWELVDQKDCYDVVLKDYIGNWDVVQPANAATEGYCYFYKDYSDSKVRVICLDGEHWDAIELSWFENVLADAKTNAMHVVCAVHRPPFLVNPIPGNTFDSVDYPNANSQKNLDGALNAINNFMAEENGVTGNFVCWICGHIHQDCMGLGQSAASNQLMISISTASVAPATPYSEMARANGEKSQDCFNIVGIETHTKILKLMRIGAQYDRHMRRRNTLCWNYGTRTLIYCD